MRHFHDYAIIRYSQDRPVGLVVRENLSRKQAMRLFAELSAHAAVFGVAFRIERFPFERV